MYIYIYVYIYVYIYGVYRLLWIYPFFISRGAAQDEPMAGRGCAVYPHPGPTQIEIQFHFLQEYGYDHTDPG
jgi:hypothetical protein